MKIKNILLSSIVSTVLLASSAMALAPVADLPKKVTYYAGLNQDDQVANAIANGASVDALIISFLRWDGFGNIKDDNEVIYSSGTSGSNAYKELRKIQVDSPKTKMIASFGGYSYAGMWDVLLDDGIRENIAQNLVLIMGNKIGKYLGKPKPIPGLDIAGIDLDFERSIRMTPGLNDALVKLVKRVKKLQFDTSFLAKYNINPSSVQNDLISLTAYHVGADPVDCATNLQLGPDDACSFVSENRSLHHGEMTRLLEAMKEDNLFDFYNLMEYDAGKGSDFHPEISIDNFVNYVPANRILGGLSIKSQWGPNGNFVATRDENVQMLNLFKSKGLRGYFTWSTGGTYESAKDYKEFSYYSDVWENVIKNNSLYVPAEFNPMQNDNLGPTVESKLGRDHSIIEKNGKKYVVFGDTWYEAGVSTPPIEASFSDVLSLLGNVKEVYNKTIIFELLDADDNIIKRAAISPRGYWSKRWRYPLLVARAINSWNLPYIKAGERVSKGQFRTLASSYRNKVWLKDLTKKVRIYSVTRP